MTPYTRSIKNVNVAEVCDTSAENRKRSAGRDVAVEMPLDENCGRCEGFGDDGVYEGERDE